MTPDVEEFPKWQLPDRFEVIEARPRTATGEFKKIELRERFANVRKPKRIS